MALKYLQKKVGPHGLIVLLLLVTATVTVMAFAIKNNELKINIPLGLITGGKSVKPELALSRLKVPDGYTIEVFANKLKGPRFMKISPQGSLLVSQPGEGNVIIFKRQPDGSLSNQPLTLIANLNHPHGLDLYKKWLYIAEKNKVIRLRFVEETGTITGKKEIIVDNLPSVGMHRTRTVRFGPDEKMYLSTGSSCNVCIESNPFRASIWQFDPDGSNGQLYASGLRNSVGLAWSPKGNLYATDNGRDFLGDDLPACELNRIEAKGFYGWPYFYSDQGETIRDTDFETPAPEKDIPLPPVYEFTAHNAPLGLHFLSSTLLPDKGSLLVALHGSWNKSYKDGYKVLMLSNPESDKPITEKDFVWGFLENGRVIGRPVDIVEDKQGTLYLSDDYGGAIYRIKHQKLPESTL